MDHLISSQPHLNSGIIIKKIFAYCYNVRGTKFADNGNISEALSEFSKAIEFDPNQQTAFFNRGTIRVDLGDIEGAKADLERAKQIGMRKSSAAEAGEYFTIPYLKVQNSNKKINIF